MATSKSGIRISSVPYEPVLKSRLERKRTFFIDQLIQLLDVAEICVGLREIRKYAQLSQHHEAVPFGKCGDHRPAVKVCRLAWRL
jgi:hypothetical protein